MRDFLTGFLCKFIGHWPTKPHPALPAYCRWCLQDMALKDGRYVVDDKIFDNQFKALIDVAAEARKADVKANVQKLFGDIKDK